MDRKSVVKAALAVLDGFTARAVLVVPTVWLTKVSEVGERLAAGVLEVTPDPVRLAVCGLPVALSATESVAVRVPVAAGLNVTRMVPPFGARSQNASSGVNPAPR